MIKSKVFKAHLTAEIDKPEGLTELEDQMINRALSIADDIIRNRKDLNLKEGKK